MAVTGEREGEREKKEETAFKYEVTARVTSGFRVVPLSGAPYRATDRWGRWSCSRPAFLSISTGESCPALKGPNATRTQVGGAWTLELITERRRAGGRPR